jgi:outer membrane protein
MSKMGAVAVGALAALAVLAFGRSADATNYTVGLGAGFAPDYDGSDDYRGVPTWRFSANDLYHPDTNITLAGPALRSNFVADPHLRAGVSGLWVSKRDDVDDKAVDRMKSTDSSVLLGGIFGWDFFAQPAADLTAALDLRYDVANGNGYLITPRLTYSNRLPDSRYSVGGELFSNWASSDYMSEYFGVSASDAARSGLNRYTPDSGFKDVGLGLNVNYRFTDHWSTTLVGTYTRLLGDAADSPIVEDRGNENQFFGGVTVNYRF